MCIAVAGENEKRVMKRSIVNGFLDGIVNGG
jgi:hypothetical protein